MGSRRTLIIIASVVVGAIAAFALYQYVDGIEDEAYEGAERVRVFVVKQDVVKGLGGDQAISEEYVKSDEIPRQFRPSTAVTDINTIRGKIALNNLSVGQVVVDGMFVDPTAAIISLSERLGTGRVAITLEYDRLRAVGGLLVPGDKVNMIVDDPADGAKRFLYQNVEIIAINTEAALQPGETTTATTTATTTPAGGGSGFITFAVSPEAALRLSLVGSTAYLTLVPPDNQPVDVPSITPEDLFSGGLTPNPDDQL